MLVTVKRDRKTDKSTTSTIAVNNVVMFVGLEPPNPIQAGTYEAWLRWSEHNRRWVIAIMNVPGHTDIEVHIGNYPCDTLDCLVVGYTRIVDAVGSSREAFSKLFAVVLSALPLDRVTFEYVDTFPKVEDGK